MSTQFRLVLVTCPSLPEARKISRALLQKHLAACVNIHTAPIESIYRWKGKIETAREHLLLIKTTTAPQKPPPARVNTHTAPNESIYRWKGKIETAREHLLLIKTTTRRLKSLEREVLRLHSYETPEFLFLPISGGSPAYLYWLSDSCKL